MPPAKNSLPQKLPKRVPKKELTAADTFEPPQFAKRTKNPDVVMQPPYHCHCNYKDYPEQKGNFFQVQGELFAANNGYFPVSKNAMEGYFQHLVQQTGDQRIAIHRVAQYLDLYVNDEIIEMMLTAPDGNITVGKLAQRSRMHQYAGKTYLDTMLEGGSPIIELKPEEPEKPTLEQTELDRAVELFGIGYAPEEYAILLQHYDMLTKQFDNADGVQDSLMRDLCTTKLMQMQARNDPDGYAKLTRLYSDTLKSSGLKTRSVDDTADDEKATWGQFIEQIERFAPAELYQQEELYKDVDGIGDYITRFFTRPTLNYFGKTDEKDPEFSLTDKEVNGEG